MSLKKPWLFLSARVAHELSAIFLKTYGAIRSPKLVQWQSFDWRGLHFANPLGTSGGLDKNAEQVRGWWAFGVGFVEVGTVTPQPQEPNPGHILDRYTPSKAVWNKMGFPNKGVAHLKTQLQKIKRPYATPVFVNIGKNRETPNENALQDYLFAVRELRDEADAFVVNVSSPNTKGLRDLLQPAALTKLLEPLIAECKAEKPLLLKLSPDLSDEDFKQVLDVSYQVGIDGWILTNTTTARTEKTPFPAEGGASGEPLKARSKHLLQLALSHLGQRKENRLLISVGGVMSPEDVFDRLRLGANLVQVYSILVFEGPGFFRRVARNAPA